MNVLIGDYATTAQFAATYALGGGVAVLGLAIAFSIRDRRLDAPLAGRAPEVSRR